MERIPGEVEVVIALFVHSTPAFLCVKSTMTIAYIAYATCLESTAVSLEHMAAPELEPSTCAVRHLQEYLEHESAAVD